VVDWLDAFARRLTAQMLANTAVDRVVRAGGGFELLSVHGALRAQRVIVATGEHGRPRWPAVPIAAGAPLVHAASLPQRAFRAADRVVVIGGGNSAAQVARGAVERGASVVVSVRRWPDRPAWMRAAGQLVRWSGGLVVRPVAEARWWLSGLPVAWLPRRGGCLAAVPLEDPWLVEAARSGRLQVVPATAAVEAGGVRLVDGRVVAADHIVAATGYLRETGCVAGLAECDADGFPQHRNGRSLAVPGLAFVGLPCMRTRRSGFLRGFAEDAAAVVNALG
jgi:putative flavoprotein involved in K+ transport